MCSFDPLQCLTPSTCKRRVPHDSSRAALQQCVCFLAAQQGNVCDTYMQNRVVITVQKYQEYHRRTPRTLTQVTRSCGKVVDRLAGPLCFVSIVCVLYGTTGKREMHYQQKT